MLLIILSVTILMILNFILMTISLILSKKNWEKREKFSPFECGFDYFSYSRLPFSIKFFLISIIFIIFDVEISLILPMIYSMLKSDLIMWIITSYFFMLILVIGVVIEWKENSLDWKN